MYLFFVTRRDLHLKHLSPFLIWNSIFQVYEDKNMGILCYTDENGELVCEGLDEGPRLTRQDMEKLNMEK
jgi:hypothetical protein